MPLELFIAALYIMILICDQVNQNWPSLFIKGQRVLIFAFSQNILCLDLGHHLYGPVPGNYHSFFIDDEGSIRKEIYDIRHPAL